MHTGLKRVVGPCKVLYLAAAAALAACSTLPGNTTPEPVREQRTLATNGTGVARSLPLSRYGRISFAALQDQVFLNEATEFLNGAAESCFARSKTSECLRWPFLHPPFGSSVRHLHRDSAIPNYSTYYYDDPLYGGSDLDCNQGWEGANVVFYAGHGYPIAWTTYRFSQPPEAPGVFDELACLDKTRIGDGAARYLLMLSCNVMAHGPRSTCTSNARAFGCPEAFSPHDPGLQSAPEPCSDLGTLETARSHHNVFARWQAHMSSQLRLACGSSTTLSPSGVPERFWHTQGVLGLPVADSFMLSLSATDEVPLCLTTGNGEPQKTPLYDQEFESTENLKQEGAYMYAMFPVRGTPAARAVAGVLMDIVGPTAPVGIAERSEDDWAPPILEVARPTLPTWLAAVADNESVPGGEFGFKSVPPDLIPAAAPEQLPQHDALTIQVHPRSGALKIRWQPAPEPSAESLRAALSSLFRRLNVSSPGQLLTGGGGNFKAEPVSSSFALQIDRVAAATATTVGPEHFQKCVYGRLEPRVKVTGPRIDDDAPPELVPHVLPVFSPGSEWLLQVCPAGPGSTPGVREEPLALAGNGEASFSLVGRQIVAAHQAVDLGTAPPRTRPVAREVAWSKLADQIGVSVAEAMETFAMPTDEVGYLAAPSHCRQTHMYPIYRFTFERRPRVPEVPESPIDIDVSVYGPGMAFASEEWVCDPQFPL